MPQQPSLLRTIVLCLIVCLMLASCHNGGSSDGGNPVNNSYLASARLVAPGTTLTDSFSYDSQHRVARFAQYITDGTNSANAIMDFTFSGSNTLPTGYTAVYSGSAADPHQLTFDGQGRIKKDTSTSGSHFVTYYDYSGDFIISRILFDGTTADAQYDTLIVTGGNIAGEKVWGEDQGAWEQSGNIVMGHAAAANPGYKAEVANSVGPLLRVLSIYNYGGYGDYISKTIINKITGTADGLPAGGYSYTVSTDGTGRVSYVTLSALGAPPGGVKTTFTYY